MRGFYGLYLSRRNSLYNAGVAQLAEHPPCKRKVAGSLPVTSSISGVSEAVITMVCLTIITGSIPVRLAIWRHRLVGQGRRPFKAETRDRSPLVLPKLIGRVLNIKIF